MDFNAYEVVMSKKQIFVKLKRLANVRVTKNNKTIKL